MVHYWLIIVLEWPKWKQKVVDAGGRPPISQELSELIVQLAKENTRWGYGKIAGELQKLGYEVSISTVRNVLKAHDILPAPVRFGSIGWRKLMGHYKDQLLACDFFTVETIRMRTLYAFFFSAPHGGVNDCARRATG